MPEVEGEAEGTSAQFASRPTLCPFTPHWTLWLGQEPFHVPPPQRAACFYPLRGLRLDVQKMDPGLPSTSTPSYPQIGGEDLERQLVWSDFIDFFHLPLFSLGQFLTPSPGKVCIFAREEVPQPCPS